MAFTSVLPMVLLALFCFPSKNHECNLEPEAAGTYKAVEGEHKY